MKLYFNPQSRAVISKWLLDEAGVDYETVLIDFKKQEHKSPEFLRLNPAGKLPVLVDGDIKIYESSAIALYIADKYPEARLAPAIDAPERGRYLSLMVFATSQLEPAMGDTLLSVATQPARGWNDFETTQDVVEAELGDGPYLFGDWFTAADVMIGSMFLWMRMFKAGDERPAIKAYADRLVARPHGLKMG